MKLHITLATILFVSFGAFAQDVEPFERVDSGLKKFCETVEYGNQKGYRVGQAYDCDVNEKFFGSFKFESGKGHPFLDGAETQYPQGGKPSRQIEFASHNKALNQTFIFLADLAGGPDSHDPKSVIFLLPRRNVPAIIDEGNVLRLILTTGEDVMIEKGSSAILSGALKEGPIDLTTNRMVRKNPNVEYTGEGISLRLSHRWLEPTESAEVVEAKQGRRQCRVARTKLFGADGKLLTQSDEELVQVLNRSCPVKPGEKAFAI